MKLKYVVLFSLFLIPDELNRKYFYQDVEKRTVAQTKNFESTGTIFLSATGTLLANRSDSCSLCCFVCSILSNFFNCFKNYKSTK